VCAPDDQRLVDVEMQQKRRLRGIESLSDRVSRVSREFLVYSKKVV
jgi:hypothetical protein